MVYLEQVTCSLEHVEQVATPERAFSSPDRGQIASVTEQLLFLKLELGWRDDPLVLQRC